MSEGHRDHRQIGRAALAALLGSMLLVGVASLGIAGAQTEDPTTTTTTSTTTTTTPPDPPVGAAAVTEFRKDFVPNVIAPGGTSTLTFTITVDAAAANLAFTDALPDGVEVASTPAASTTNCGAPTWAPTAGATSLSFSGGIIAAPGSCTVEVDVTALTSGAYENTTSTLTSDQPTVAAAINTLYVAPSFTKAFEPQQIEPGGVATLAFAIDNTGVPDPVTGLQFTDTLPTTPGAMTVASTPAATTDCSAGTVTADAGSGTITFSGGTVDADSSCTVTVDITAPTAGTYDNSVELTSDLGTGGTATASLVVTPIAVTKTFVEGSIASGGTATFNITIRNDGTEDLSNVVATDALATDCNRTFTTLAVDATETYTCSLANVASTFTNTVVVNAEGATSGIALTAQASTTVTVTTPTPAIPAAQLAATGGSTTGMLAAIGFGILLLGFVLALASSQHRFRFIRR